MRNVLLFVFGLLLALSPVAVADPPGPACYPEDDCFECCIGMSQTYAVLNCPPGPPTTWGIIIFNPNPHPGTWDFGACAPYYSSASSACHVFCGDLMRPTRTPSLPADKGDEAVKTVDEPDKSRLSSGFWSYPDLTKAEPGEVDRVTYTRDGHTVTITGVGGKIAVTEEGFLTNDVDNPLNEEGVYPYSVIRVYPPVSDAGVALKGPADGANMLMSWVNSYNTYYSQFAGMPSRAYLAGPGIMGHDPWDSVPVQVFGVGYDRQPRFTEFYFYGEADYIFVFHPNW